MKLVILFIILGQTQNFVVGVKSGYDNSIHKAISNENTNILWTHSESLDDNGDILLKWLPTDSDITFRVEAKTLGYVAIGFRTVLDVKNTDIVVAWVDSSGNAQILDCYGSAAGTVALTTDDTRNYQLLSGAQNKTHTIVEFRRSLDTCDAQDIIINQDTIQVLWALGPPDSDGQLPTNGMKNYKPLRLLQPIVQRPVTHTIQWDVNLTNLTIPDNMATFFWCKIFQRPDLVSKHHIIGYEPIIDSRALLGGRPVAGSNSPVRHMLLFECAEEPDADRQVWSEWAESKGYFGPDMPREWASCITPIAAWAAGSKGEFFPDNVGIPLADKGGVTFYKLEIHYDNEAQHKVLDSSGLRIHYTNVVRIHDAALMGAGEMVSALHFVPPFQKQYTTAGYCSPECTKVMFPEDGIKIVSVLLHAHMAGRKLKLRHIRGNQELPVVAQENQYDYRYQQSRIVPGGRHILGGDSLLMECTYDTLSRLAPTLGGYAAHQEMCLAFILYYPRISLAGCYSMTPAKEFFETFGVREFYGRDMTQVENLFLASGVLDSIADLLELGTYSPDNTREYANGVDQGVSLLSQLIIREPVEFRNKSFMAHLKEIPWNEKLLTTKIERTLYKGKHTTFCKKRDDSLAVPIETLTYPNYTDASTEDNETSKKSCHYKILQDRHSGLPSSTASNCVAVRTILCCIFYLFFVK